MLNAIYFLDSSRWHISISILHFSIWCSYPNEDLVDDTQGDSKDDKPVEWVSSWKPNITINLVDDFTR